MPHKDGPLYFPVVTILSLGSDCVMTFTKDDKSESLKVLIPARSLFQFSGELYERFLHEIDFSTTDVIDYSVLFGGDARVSERTQRFSLTFRYVDPIVR